MSDADHEVIDSPEALFRHLYDEHGVEEALDLDPETAPVQFWLRRHAELERAQRAARRHDEPPPEPEAHPRAEAPWPHPDPEARRRPEPQPRPRPRAEPEARPRPEPEVRSRAEARPPPERRHARFGDPLVEAMARALAGRGHDEAAVRSAIRSFTGSGGEPAGEAAVRAAFIEPMLRTVAERLLGLPAAPEPAGQSQPPPSAPTPREEEPARPEAAWAVLWADLAETRRPGGNDQGPGGDEGDDLMAVANAVQQRRRVRLLRR
jgi:hypothetical protein